MIPGTERSPAKNFEGYRLPSEQGMFYENVEIKSTNGVKLSQDGLLNSNKTSKQHQCCFLS